jgi:non-specific protein-tyrosine kinase
MVLDEKQASPLQKTGVDNLWLLPSGPKPPNPADLLGSRQVDRVIERLSADADMILIDAPPVIGVTDAVVLGAKVDGVLLVISAGETRREHAERAKELLEKANVRIIGATLTNAPRETTVSNYYE